MKRVVLVRHGKAVPYGYDADFERELQERGKKDADRISKLLKEKGIIPDLIISSPANRAIHTARIFAENTDYPFAKIRQEEDIYEGLTPAEFLESVQSLSDEMNTVFFFGHNPGFYYYASNLLTHFYDELPTCATLGIDFPVDSWKQVKARTGGKAFLFKPKELR